MQILGMHESDPSGHICDDFTVSATVTEPQARMDSVDPSMLDYTYVNRTGGVRDLAEIFQEEDELRGLTPSSHYPGFEGYEESLRSKSVLANDTASGEPCAATSQSHIDTEVVEETGDNPLRKLAEGMF